MKYINLLMSHKTEVGAENHTVSVWLWGSWKKQNKTKTKCDGRLQKVKKQKQLNLLYCPYVSRLWDFTKKKRQIFLFFFTVLSLREQFMMWVCDGRLQRVPNPSSVHHAACLWCVQRVMWLCDFKTPVKLCDFKTPVKLTVLSFCNQFMIWLCVMICFRKLQVLSLWCDCVMVGFRKLQVLSLWCDCMWWWASESSKSWVYGMTVCDGGL